MRSIFVDVLTLTAAVSATAARGPPTVLLKNGTLSGSYSKTYNQDYFLGIPYAQPPVHSLRFRQAQSLNSTWEGVREATEFSKLCVGYGV
jgi:carboxylesterase type B